jgi:hypothetical protein
MKPKDDVISITTLLHYASSLAATCRKQNKISDKVNNIFTKL